jgi:hypothetical protein
MMKVIKVVAVLVALAIALAWPLNYAAHRGLFGEGPRQCAQYFFKRSDLYEPLYSGSISSFMTGSSHMFSFRNRYAGIHTVDVLVARGVEPKKPELEAPYLISSLKCYSGNRLLLEKTQHSVLGWFWGPRGDGFSLFEYSAPRDLPLDAAISCELRFAEGQTRFWSEHDVQTLEVVKRSEE